MPDMCGSKLATERRRGASSTASRSTDAEEAVVELNVVLEAEVEHGLFERQPIPLALATRYVRMCSSGDEIEHVRVALDDCGQRLDRGLQALTGRDQAEGRENEAVVDP